MTPPPFGGDIVGLGRRALPTLRRALERELGDQAALLLQEAGFSAGDQVYAALRRWLATNTDVHDPAELGAAAMGDVLSDFFGALGWGGLTIERLGPAALAVDTGDWAEAEPGGKALAPSCHVSAGLLASLLGHLADRDVAVMEIECRSRNDARCRFLAGSQDTLQAVYLAMSEGRDYHEALGATAASS